MRKYIFGSIVIVAIAIGFFMTSNPIDTCPTQVQEVAMEFAAHAESKIVDAQFVKSEPSLTGKVVRHYWDVTFKQGSTSHTRRISLPIDRGIVCKAKFIN